jgi:hypothetical protein
MKIKQHSYGTLEIDNTEKDHVQVWCDEGTDPQVIHIERKNLQQFIVALMNTCIEGKLLLQLRYVKDNCMKPRKQLATELGMTEGEFIEICKKANINLRLFRSEANRLKDSRKPPLLINS